MDKEQVEAMTEATFKEVEQKIIAVVQQQFHKDMMVVRELLRIHRETQEAIIRQVKLAAAMNITTLEIEPLLNILEDANKDIKNTVETI